MTTTIRQYWDSRAATNRDSPAATTNDVHLRRLEARTLIAAIRELRLPDNSTLIDMGCGDGATTIAIAQSLPKYRFIGLDYASAMIENARSNLSRTPEIQGRVRFVIGDVAAPAAQADLPPADAAFSCRCLINLPDDAVQRLAFERIARLLKPGSVYLAIENFVEGQDGMNNARAAVGLQPIPVRWHNHFFTKQSLLAAIDGLFALVRIDDFSSAYYFATRVIYSKMCHMRGEEPDYDHDIHRLAVDLPSVGCFSPIRLAVLKRT